MRFFPEISLLRSSGPFLESFETFRTYFGLHSSLCIFKRKRLEARNFAFILFFIPFTAYEKNSHMKRIHRISGLLFYEWLFGPGKFSDSRETGPRSFVKRPGKLSGPKSKFLKLWSACREKLLFKYVSCTMKGKISAKFQRLKPVLIEDIKRKTA